MANLPFERTIINVRERPLSSDINQGFSQMDYTIREMLFRLLQGVDPTSGTGLGTMAQGFLGDSFRPTAGTGMTVQVQSGLGFQNGAGDNPTNIGGALNLDDLSTYKPLVLTQTQTISVPAADPVLHRIDLIEARYDRRAENALSRDILNTTTGQFQPNLVNKTLSPVLNGLTSVNGSARINYKTGTPHAMSPVAPSVTAGYLPIGLVRVPGGSASIQAQYVTDIRPMLAPGGVHRFGIQASINAGVTPWQIISAELYAPPGILMTFYISRYTSGGYSGNHSIGLLASGPQFRNRQPSIVASATLSNGEYGTFALAAQPVMLSPITNSIALSSLFFEPQQASTFPGVVAYYPNPDPIHPQGSMGILGAEWFPIRWKQSTGTWVQGTDALIDNSWTISIQGLLA